jgi:hypothetical protein
MVFYKTSQITGDVDVSGSVGLSRLDLIRFTETTIVAANTLTTILSFTAIATTNIALLTASGQDYAKYDLFVDSVQIGTKRSGPSRNVEWSFQMPLALDIASVLQIKVTHFYTAETVDFEAGMYAFTS